MSGNWREQRERGGVIALRLILWIARRLGRPVARALLYPITLYFFLTSPSARSASRDYLGRVTGQRVGMGQVFRHLHAFASVILDRVYFIAGETDKFDIRVHGYEAVADTMRSGGVILLGAHMGSFDAVRCMALDGYGVRLKVLMQHDHNQLITRLLESINPAVAKSVIPLGQPGSLLRAAEWLDEGGSVGMLGDRVVGDSRYSTCQFLGAPARFPTGPWLVARRLGVPVVLFFGCYRGGNRYDIRLEVVGRLPVDDPEDKHLHEAVRLYANRLEGQVSEAPFNWFNFYDFWAEAVPRNAVRASGGSGRGQ